MGQGRKKGSLKRSLKRILNGLLPDCLVRFKTFNANNLGETLSYELFRVHWFRVRECLVGVLDLWVVVSTTERGGCLGCSASVLLIRLPTLGRGATTIFSTGYIIIEGAIALSLDRHRRACVNHLFKLVRTSKSRRNPSLHRLSFLAQADTPRVMIKWKRHSKPSDLFLGVTI